MLHCLLWLNDCDGPIIIRWNVQIVDMCVRVNLGGLCAYQWWQLWNLYLKYLGRRMWAVSIKHALRAFTKTVSIMQKDNEKIKSII